MGYQDNKRDMCKGSSIGKRDPEAYENETGEVYQSPCNWVTTGTYSDECTTCGAQALYN